MPTFDPGLPSGEFRDQWTHPGDVFSILLLLGGDVIARALAQLTGNRLAPVSFSFGWVAYSVSALVSAVGENRLMPTDPDCKSKVIKGKSGYTRDNSSWIIGRIVRDFDYWSDAKTKEKTARVLDDKWKELQAEDPQVAKPQAAGLIVTIYRPSEEKDAMVLELDMLYWSGFVTTIVQLGVAAIPCALLGDWGILLITSVGIALALATSALPQWRKEKWACRKDSSGTYVLTKGNGAQHAIVVLGNGRGLNLEDLAAGQINLNVSPNAFTRAIIFCLSALWVLLLITAAGLKNNTWFLLAVGGIGMVQNIFAAGWQRRPENFGIPLDFVEVFGEMKVMRTLYEVEARYPRVGRSMLEEFFPGKLNDEEKAQWKEFDDHADKIDKDRKEAAKLATGK